MNAFGIMLLFEGAECSVVPFGDPIDLDERLTAFCRAVLSDPNVAACVAGLHGHRPGECARK